MEDSDLAIPVERETAATVKAQVQLIQEVMKAVMKDGTHYGTVPGCGNKKVLLKPGAEVLMTTFRLAVDPEVEELPTANGFSYRVKVRVTSQKTGLFLGAGIGEASTKEEKYHWRKAVNQAEYDATPEDERRVKYGSYNGKDSEIKQVMTNPADKANTVLKMAKKRALVDAVLTITAASDIFTQDLDPDEDGGGATPKKKSDSVKPKGQGKPKDEKTPRQKLREAIEKICAGDERFYDETLLNCSKFTKDGKEHALTSMAQIDDPDTNEVWIKASLGTARKFIAEMEKDEKKGEAE